MEVGRLQHEPDEVVAVPVRGGRGVVVERLTRLASDACEGLGGGVDPQLILDGVLKDLYDGVPFAEVRKALVMSARALIEKVGYGPGKPLRLKIATRGVALYRDAAELAAAQLRTLVRQESRRLVPVELTRKLVPTVTRLSA